MGNIHANPVPDDADSDIERAAGIAVACLRARGTLFLAGNGGSFADALHVAGELCKNFERDRRLPERVRARLTALSGRAELAESLHPVLRVVVLGTNPVLTSAVDNDLPARHLGFAQELCALGGPGDALFAISTSGESENLVNAVHTAHALDMQVITLTGPGPNALAGLADAPMRAAGDTTAAVQTNYVASYHRFCRLVEDAFVS